ncbi:HNH endonuclease [Methanobrevibacter sp.]|uniref:HNH endonuclease n=1 Tax=Methanobrevibacter sp. TaxID=66852 RepID=UPI0025D10BB0|nr:HNH endonuclease [Methanobrevibacter sp.]MBQ2832364.1 HNH endonuclease [Methanobrevibacter sp.]
MKRPTKTLCKYCDKCEDFEYIRFDRNGNLQCFQYCKGGAGEVKLSEWYIQKDGYAYSTGLINGHKIFYHTLFKKDENMIIDHINGDRTDNRLRMLREISPSENSQNNILWKHKRVTSKFPGVYWNRHEECWMCVARKHKRNHPEHQQISKQGFKTEYEAFDYYLKLLKELGREVNTETESFKDYLKWKGEQQQVTLDVF